MIWDWSYVWKVLPPLADAATITIQATLLGFPVAVLGGLLLVLLRRAPWRIVSWPSEAVFLFIRNTPLLPQLYFLYFGLPAFGLYPSAMLTGILGLGLHYSTYISEVYRAGFDSVPRGQWEAAKALNYPPIKKYQLIVLPQAIPPIVPVLGNYLVAMFKDTPLLSAITIVEMLQQAKLLGADSFKYMEPITIVGLFFLIMSLIAAVAIRWTENKLEVRTR